METQLPAPVTAVNSDEYGHQLVVSTQNNEVSVFQAGSMTIVSRIQIANATPLSVDFSATEFGPLIAVGCSDGAVHIYQNGRAVQTFKNSGSVLSVAFHRSKCMLAAASLNGTFSVYQRNGASWETLSIPVTFMGLTSICWGSESDTLQTLIVGGADGAVRVFKSAGGTWELSAAAQVHNGWVRCVTAPNVPLGNCQKVASCGDDGKAGVLKIVNNKVEISEIRDENAIGGVAWAMVDKTLVVSHTNGDSTMWKEGENEEWVKK